VHLSRLGEDLIVYSSREFGFVTLADAYSTGSSLMPQKKNPDALELLRGKTGRVAGSLTGVLMTLKGLPSSYNKDLQEDKEPLFDAVDTLAATLQIACGVISTLRPNADRLRGALASEMLATDLAEYLVRKGVPFRETHHIAGAAVALAEGRGVPLSALTVADLQGLHPAFSEDVVKVWDFEQSVESRDVTGGTSRRAVLAQIAILRRWVNETK
jgi:argininosuccinate lyase